MDLQKITLDNAPDWQQLALLRLQLVVTSMTHALLLDVLSDLRTQIFKVADGEGIIPLERAHPLAEAAASSLRQALGEWERLFANARREAVAIPLGTMTVMHNHYAGLTSQPVEEALDVVSGGPPTFEPQLQEILDVTANRVYGDGFQLSDRVWNLGQRSSEGIRRVVMEGISSGESAFSMAQRLEGYLGAGEDCPRWTATRLYGLTPQERINSEKGLFSGSPCEMKGVAYNALRLARNEIQIAHHEATRLIHRRQPWIEGESIQLSPQHPQTDICDDYAQGGPYEIGEVPLPIHVQCLCYSTAVRMGEDVFVDQVRGWMDGSQSWPEMDQYAEFSLGQGLGQRALSPVAWALGQALSDWIDGGQDVLESRLHRITEDVVWWVVGEGG